VLCAPTTMSSRLQLHVPAASSGTSSDLSMRVAVNQEPHTLEDTAWTAPRAVRPRARDKLHIVRRARDDAGAVHHARNNTNVTQRAGDRANAAHRVETMRAKFAQRGARRRRQHGALCSSQRQSGAAISRRSRRARDVPSVAGPRQCQRGTACSRRCEGDAVFLRRSKRSTGA